MRRKIINGVLNTVGGLPPQKSALSKLWALLVVALLSGCRNLLMDPVEGLVSETGPNPETPDDFSAYPGDSEIILTWGKSNWEDFESYEIYQDKECIAVINNRSTNSFTVTNLENGVEYQYQLRIRDLQGKVSPFSALIKVVPQAALALTIPQNFSGKAGDGEVTLSWAQNGDKRFYQYEIYRDNDLLVTIAEQATVSYLDTGLVNNQSYQYKMRVASQTEEVSQFSSELAIIPQDILAPAIPVNIEASAGDGQVAISWQANSEGDFASYQVYRKSIGDWEAITTITDIATNYFQDINLINGQEYTYAVTAKDVWGNENLLADVPTIAVTPQDTTSPDKPVDFGAALNQLTTILEWSASLATDFAYYELYRDNELLATISDKNIVAYEDAGLSYQTTYTYSLLVYDQSGNVSEPAQLTITTPIDEAPPGVEEFSVNATETEATLSWAPSAIQDFLSYNIYRDNILLQTISDQATTSYLDADLTTNRMYQYQMNVSDQAGNLSGNTPLIAVTPRDVTAPPAPASLRGEGSKGYVELRWDPVNVGDFERYEVYRDDMLIEEFYDMNLAYFADTSANQAGQQYSYKLKVVDNSGNISPVTEIITVKVRDPYGFQEVTISDNKLTVAWDYEGTIPDSFKIYYRPHGSIQDWLFLGETTETKYTVEWGGPSFNGVWDYAVTSIEDDKESERHTSLDENADPATGWYINWNYTP